MSKFLDKCKSDIEMIETDDSIGFKYQKINMIKRDIEVYEIVVKEIDEWLKDIFMYNYFLIHNYSNKKNVYDDFIEHFYKEFPVIQNNEVNENG